MNVPPFVPEPIEIPGNVAEERHSVMVAFMRRVVLMHLASVAIVYGIAFSPTIGLPLPPALVLLAASLAGLSIVRTLTKPSRIDQLLSLLLFPFVLLSLGWVLRALMEQGFPAWAPLVGLAAALLYTFACGRDFSFVGQFTLSVIASSIALAWITVAVHESSAVSTEALALNAAYLFYWVYDLASLLTRRRRGEEAGAVIDLYRDILNFITYPIRTVRHWRESRIWRV